MKRVLTGITTTGEPHLGNYAGAIKPSIQISNDQSIESYFFLADYHSIIKNLEPDLVRKATHQIAASWMALGLNDRSIFYRQSDIPEIFELSWILTCSTAKGLMNRAHAYKAATEVNAQEKNMDTDKGVTMGLFSYPILMASDILLFKANEVPVGRDQIQHVEMARDIARRFNHFYGDLLVVPKAVTTKSSETLLGLDGRKMSKSYHNTIPLFCEEIELKKLINKIKTNSLEPGISKDHKSCTLYQIYCSFSSDAEIKGIEKRYLDGISWGDMKVTLFEKVNDFLKPSRDEYKRLLNEPDFIEKKLEEGAARARDLSVPYIKQLRQAVGINKVGYN
jgi:tryptophanyl-tRNA synthetase